MFTHCVQSVSNLIIYIFTYIGNIEVFGVLQVVG